MVRIAGRIRRSPEGRCRVPLDSRERCISARGAVEGSWSNLTIEYCARLCIKNEGTAEQLVSEDLLPAGFEFPRGTRSYCGTHRGKPLSIRRRRPRNYR